MKRDLGWPIFNIYLPSRNLNYINRKSLGGANGNRTGQHEGMSRDWKSLTEPLKYVTL